LNNYYQRMEGTLVTRLTNLIEQTAFLLEKQKEANADCAKLFGDLLNVVKARRATKPANQEEGEALESIATLIEEQAQHLKDDAQADIEFLEEQLQALTKVQTIKDPVKAKELLSMLIDEDEEVKDTATFMKEVNDEAVVSRENLLTMLNDLQDAIKDGNASDVALYLESILENDEEDEDDEECDDENCNCEAEEDSCCDDDDEDGCCDEDDEEDGCCEEEEEAGDKKKAPKTGDKKSACGGCAGGGCGKGCGTGCGSETIDIFGSLKKYEQELLQDDDDSVKH